MSEVIHPEMETLQRELLICEFRALSVELKVSVLDVQKVLLFPLTRLEDDLMQSRISIEGYYSKEWRNLFFDIVLGKP